MFHSARSSRQDQARKLYEEIACLAIVVAIAAFHFGGAAIFGVWGSIEKTTIPGPMLLVEVVIAVFVIWRLANFTPHSKRVFWAVAIWMLLWALAVCAFGAAPAHAAPLPGGYCKGAVASFNAQDASHATIFCVDGSRVYKYPSASIIFLASGRAVIIYGDQWSVVVNAGGAKQYDPALALRSATDSGGSIVFGVWHAEPLIDPR